MTKNSRRFAKPSSSQPLPELFSRYASRASLQSTWNRSFCFCTAFSIPDRRSSANRSLASRVLRTTSASCALSADSADRRTSEHHKGPKSLRKLSSQRFAHSPSSANVDSASTLRSGLFGNPADMLSNATSTAVVALASSSDLCPTFCADNASNFSWRASARASFSFWQILPSKGSPGSARASVSEQTSASSASALERATPRAPVGNQADSSM
mmetsp:Transcript_75003/g.243774  ORF Transcript_75003/g.243774 Transcript_75003/m.243774 type:complete len:213 (-) Transcript_75003:3367-4005(-)